MTYLSEYRLIVPDNDWCIRYCLVTKEPLTLMFFSQHPDQLIVIIYYGLFTINPAYMDLLRVYYTYVHVMQHFFARFCSLIKMSLTPVEDNQGVRLLMETFAFCISFTSHLFERFYVVLCRLCRDRYVFLTFDQD